MADIISDNLISEFLAERKLLEPDWRRNTNPRSKANARHAEREIEVIGESANKFVLWIRQNIDWIEDFTVGLRIVRPSGEHLILKRYNGPSHRHVNHIERLANAKGHTFEDRFHIHVATERYQRAGRAIDGYATPVTTFTDRHDALDRMIAENGFAVDREPGGQKLLFDK